MEWYSYNSVLNRHPLIPAELSHCAAFEIFCIMIRITTLILTIRIIGNHKHDKNWHILMILIVALKRLMTMIIMIQIAALMVNMVKIVTLGKYVLWQWWSLWKLTFVEDTSYGNDKHGENCQPLKMLIVGNDNHDGNCRPLKIRIVNTNNDGENCRPQ